MAISAIPEVIAPVQERLSAGNADNSAGSLQTSTQAARSGWAPTPGRKPDRKTGVVSPVLVEPQLAANTPVVPETPAAPAADGGWTMEAPDEYVNQPPFDSGLKQGLEHRRLAAVVGMAPGQMLVESNIPVLRNLGVTLASAGRLVSSPFTLVGGVLTLDKELAKDGAEDFVRGVLGLVGLEHIVMDEYVSPKETALTGTVSAPRAYAAAIINAGRDWREYAKKDERNGMKGWHTYSNASIAAHASVPEAALAAAMGVGHEFVDVGSALNEIKAQGVGNWLYDSVGDVGANIIGLLTGLFLPESMHLDVARVMSRAIPGPNDPNPEGIDLGTSDSKAKK